MNSAKIQAEICALRERIQERDMMAAQMATNEEEGPPKVNKKGRTLQYLNLKRREQTFMN